MTVVLGCMRVVRLGMAQPSSNPFAGFRCRKVRAADATALAAARQPPSSKSAAAETTPEAGTAERQQVAPAALHAGKGTLKQMALTAQRQRPAKRKAASSADAKSAPAESPAGQPPPKGVPELLGNAPLRLILVGHNPSDHAWKSGHYYSNPSNWMWRLLKATGIAPPEVRGAEDDHLMPEYAGVGFVDVGCGVPGTASNQFSSAVVGGWGAGFCLRLAGHMQRASDAIGCTCGQCGAPAVVAFTGKRQFSELINHGKRGKAKVTNIPLGPQTLRPEGWPLPPSTAVWVLTSTSGASPMTNAARKEPYQALADTITSIPRQRTPVCASAAQRGAAGNGVASSSAALKAESGTPLPAVTSEVESETAQASVSSGSDGTWEVSPVEKARLGARQRLEA